MNDYEAKQERKRERLEGRADKARANSAALLDRSHKMAEAIPFGQPILVGHHSEGRDRRYRQKIHDTTRKGFQELDRAKDLERRAEAVGTGGISSDDPDAIAKLQVELASVEESQRVMKAVNQVIRKHKADDARRGALADLLTAEQIDRALTPDFMGRIGFPGYALSNNNANARRIRLRIEQLQAARQRPSSEVEGKGYTYREDADENRVMFLFAGKPDPAVRDVLKRHAFRWSPSRGAWVRQLTGAGRMAGQLVREALDTQGV